MELISGKEALIALANGEDVEYFSNADYTWKNIFNYHPKLEVMVSKELDVNHKFRLKPRTITLNGIEVPAPFNPKRGGEVWFISDDHGCGYASITCNRFTEFKYGVWDSEEKVKQVVDALRKVFKEPQQ